MSRPLLARIINPVVPWPVAVACNAVGAVTIALLLVNPASNLKLALCIVIPAAIVLYGTALARWLAGRKRGTM